jgi:pimeloyl-ACP methyl ester carboxylesterase
MKRHLGFAAALTASCLLGLLVPASVVAQADGKGGKGFLSQEADVDGTRLHYLRGGAGPAVLLLHGYAETSRMWIPAIPVLGKRFTVVAPDLPGIGDSAIPSKGLDMKSAAVSIHALVRSLGIEKARVVGHDIGLMVAYAYAALYPSQTEQLILMDAFLPGVEGWREIYDNPGIWHFRFNGLDAEKIVQGRERTYFEHFWNGFAADPTRSIPEAERVAYTAAYSRPGRMRAGWAYFVVFPATATEFAELAKTRLAMPVLSIGGEKANGEALGRQVKLVAPDATVVVVKDSGHWLMEEKPKETMAALEGFLK